MPHEYRSILWQTLRIRVGELLIRGVALHRHLPEITALGQHRHRFHQILAYLAGQGIQQVEDHRQAVGTGSLVLLPAGTPHAFHRLSQRPPSCLVLEFDLPHLPIGGPAIRQLSALETGKLRALLSRLAKLPQRSDAASDLAKASLVIDLAQTLLAAANPDSASAPERISPIAHRVRKILESDDSDTLTVAEIAARAGYQPDYLGRRIKAETGLTLGQWRSRERVARAKQALAKHATIGEAGAAVGFFDQNYFARWFREQTGFTPSVWKLHREDSR